jgi:hypothetical protein
VFHHPPARQVDRTSEEPVWVLPDKSGVFHLLPSDLAPVSVFDALAGWTADTSEQRTFAVLVFFAGSQAAVALGICADPSLESWHSPLATV